MKNATQRRIKTLVLVSSAVGMAISSRGAEVSAVGAAADLEFVGTGAPLLRQAHSPDDGQVCWSWGAADAATLRVDARLAGTSVTYEYTASDTPAWTIPATADELYDLTLTLKKAGATIDTLTARVAVPAGTIDVRSPELTRNWSKTPLRAMYAYDSAWYGVASPATAGASIVRSDSMRYDWTLPVAAGFDVLDLAAHPVGSQKFKLALSFDGTIVDTSAELARIGGGLAIFFR